MRGLLATSLAMVVFLPISAGAAEGKTLDLILNGQLWASTVITPYDDSSKEARDATYKVYTHVMDFTKRQPLTKGEGGQYPHHRGLFIGWRETTVGGKKYDTWHMTDCYQQYVGTIKEEHGGDWASHSMTVEWRDADDDHIFIDEDRIVRAQAAPGGTRVFDFTSVLTAVEGDTTLRGDSHHAGMQIRLANEVAEHPEATVYTLPEGAKRLENDEVSGAPWVVCNVEILGTKYWVMHMTPPELSAPLKLYSIRPYARFGAFFEPDLKKGDRMAFTFRIVVSTSPIDLAAANTMYDEYASGHVK